MVAAGNGCRKWRTLVSKSIKKAKKKSAIFLLVWLPWMSVEGCICIETNLDDERRPLIAI